MPPRSEFEAIHHDFLELEEELNVFDIEIDGVPVWERIRLTVRRQVMYSKDIWSQFHSQLESNWRNYLRGIGLFARNFIYRNPYFADEATFLFWGHERRKQLEDGQWWDIYCDPIHDTLELDYLHVESLHVNQHLTPAKTDRLYYLDISQYYPTIRRKLGLTDFSFESQDAERLKEIENAFAERFDADIVLQCMIRRELIDRRARKGLYKRLLRRVQPEVVVVVVSNGKETFIEACQDSEIPVVELQHGIITKYEYQYAFAGDRTKVMFPDYLLTFGDHWTEAVPYPIPRSRVLTVGYPYLEENLRKYENATQSDQVLFLSQGPVGPTLSKIAVKMSSSTRFSGDVVYKLHPGEFERWEDEYPWLMNSDVTVIEGDEPPMYRLFAESQAQVGVYSTAIHEGLMFGLDTYLIDLPGVEYVSDLYEDGQIPLLETADDVLTEMNADRTQSVDMRRYFEPNAVENIAETLSNIRNCSD